MKIVTKSVKSLMMASLAVSLAGGLTSCNNKGCIDPEAINYDSEAKKDDGSCEYEQGAEISKSGTISADETWTSINTYLLDGKVVVADGVTLTIEAGTIIKGKEGQESQASALVVARGGKLMAEGTASSPIIFTSVLDNIATGELVGTNLEKTDNQLWGGVVICGKAPVSAENGDTEGNIEGINPSDNFGKYGGSDATDNSGTIAYVSIRHGGISIGEGNELNGLTLGGVGSGTSISNIEIYATLDDGIECFGGTVNISNALVFYQGDDGIDLDQNYAGTISSFAVIQGDGVGTDEGLEIDGPEGSTNTTGLFTLTNGLCKKQGTEGTPADLKSKAQGTISNVTFEYGSTPIKIRASFDSGCAAKTDAAKNVESGILNINNSSWASLKVYENAETPTCVDETAAAQTAVEAALSAGSGGTVNPAALFSWGAAGIRGEL
jgi:hypothetical protein